MSSALLSALSGSHIQPVAAIEVRPSLIVDIWGPEHSGKTHFAAGAPDKRGHFYQSLEPYSTDEVLTKSDFRERQIVRATYDSDIPTEVSRSEFDKVKNHFKTQRTRFATDLKKALKAGVSTITWDKASSLWEVIRYEHFGRLSRVPQHLYGPANAEFSDLVNACPQAGVNLILINESEAVWKDQVKANGDVERVATADTKRKGQDRTGQLVDVSLRAWKEGKPPKFFLEIRECRKRPDLIGKVYENGDFLQVALDVKPEVPAEVWL